MIHIYSVLTQILSAKISLDRLQEEIGVSSITPTIVSVGLESNIVTINFQSALSSTEVDTLTALVLNHSGDPIVETTAPSNVLTMPFASNLLGTGETIHKRVTGVSNTVLAGTTGFIDFTVPYVRSKLKGAKIINTAVGDYLDFVVLDTDTNYYSGYDPLIYGANLQIDKFGYNVYTPNNYLDDTADYAGDIYQGMIIRCVYTNSTPSDKIIYMNVDLHEVVVKP